MVLGFLGFLVDPTDVFKSKTHRQFSKCLVWVITALIGSITPLAFLTFPLLAFGYTFSLFGLRELTGSSRFGVLALGLWCLLEIMFYYHCYLLKLKFRPHTNFQGGIPTHERDFLLKNYLEQCANAWEALARWFPNHEPEDIGVECMEEWLCWAYFSKNCKDLNEAENQELLGLMKQIVKKCPRIGRPSAEKPLNFMQLHFDELVVQHKPLIAMLVIMIMQVSGVQFLSWMGFQHHSLPGNTTLSYYSYHSSPNQHPTKRPVFFVHGIGIGIAMYFNVIKAVVQADPERPVYILDLPHVSLKIVDHVPNMEETLEAIDEIFARHQLKDCSWLAHSYGTVVNAWVMKERPKYVSKLTLVDPVCFALWEPDLIYNFLYRVPPGPIHRLCQFFVAQDLLVSYTLFRNFWWSQNILFPQHITCPAKVFLSSHDMIIDCNRIQNYLIKNPANISNSSNGRGEPMPWPFEVVKMMNLGHGSFLSSPKYLQQIVNHL